MIFHIMVISNNHLWCVLALFYFCICIAGFWNRNMRTIGKFLALIQLHKLI